MDGILALGHFCESHGPCVILCTQRCDEEPNHQWPHTLTVPWCEACQSIDLDQALMSKDSKGCYITTRTPLQQDLAFLLKQATVRSLSCEEETSGEGAPLYFGDHERGHVLSHTFTLQDSLARGFHRKYTILMLMRDKIHLLNAWPTLVKHIKEIVKELKTAAAEINDAEQIHRSQRAVRQAQGSPGSTARSLSQLTGKPAVFAHLHLWFCWLLSCSLAIEKPTGRLPGQNSIKPSSLLRAVYSDMGEVVFKTAAFWVLSGINLIFMDESHSQLLQVFKSLLPENWGLKSDVRCRLVKRDVWEIECAERLPQKLPSLLVSLVKVLDDKRLPDVALESQVTSLVMYWFHTARSLCWCPNINVGLLQSFGIQRSDLPLLQFWTVECCDDLNRRFAIKEQLHKCLCIMK